MGEAAKFYWKIIKFSCECALCINFKCVTVLFKNYFSVKLSFFIIHSQATLFTAHAWINQDCKESIVIISDDLNHTKNAVYTFMSFLYNHLTNKYPTIETINTFSDGAASQFKQRYLFSNLHTWE